MKLFPVKKGPRNHSASRRRVMPEHKLFDLSGLKRAISADGGKKRA